MQDEVIWGRRRRSDDDHRDRMRRIPLFDGLADQMIDLLDEVLTEAHVDAGKRLVVAGAVGRDFALILEGLASVVRDDVEVARLGPHTFFGEHALLTGNTRSADVIALTPMRLLVAGPSEFHRMLRELPLVAERISAADQDRQGGNRSPALQGGS